MRAGKLRHRVTIQSKTVTRNAVGEEVVTWSLVGTYWAAISPLRGRELLEQRRDGAEVTTLIRLRYQFDTIIEPEHRAIWGDHKYDVLSVIYVEEANREIHLMVREILSDEWVGD